MGWELDIEIIRLLGEGRSPNYFRGGEVLQ